LVDKISRRKSKFFLNCNESEKIENKEIYLNNVIGRSKSKFSSEKIDFYKLSPKNEFCKIHFEANNHEKNSINYNNEDLKFKK
jgi:hypothetical protein